MFLSELTPGQEAIIVKVKGRGAFRKRITEMGFVAGRKVSMVKRAPLGDPVEYSLMGYHVSLRNSEAAMISIQSGEVNEIQPIAYQGTHEQDSEKPAFSGNGNTINVVFVGNPNSGKTTLFNQITRAHERVGNYGGVTVEAKEAEIEWNGRKFVLVDLPGTYSISAYSPEELFVRDYIVRTMPDIVVNVLDASNLERNLFLTTQLIDMDLRVVCALNMYDELLQKGDKLNYELLGKLLGIPMVATIAPRGKGIHALFEKMVQVMEGAEDTSRHIHIHYGLRLEEAISSIQAKLKGPENAEFLITHSSRFIALRLLENDTQAHAEVMNLPKADAILSAAHQWQKKIEDISGAEPENLITDTRYAFIAGALNETFKANPRNRKRRSDMADRIITHKFWGIPIFLGLMWFTFFTTFKLGNYPMQWIGMAVEALSGMIEAHMPSGMLKDLVIQGIIGGVGGVIVFLPNILILYLFISLMEDTGYMARAVFIMDKVMHRLGLHGKSFIPLLMGFGCNVPAILSTRIIESRRDRLLTMLINPFMSCSARLPVYILLITAFFSSYQSSILFALYFTGITLAVVSAWLFRITILRKKDVPFVMELPPYRMPTFKSVAQHVTERTGQYLRKIGGIILVASILIWALGYFPLHYPEKSLHEQQLIQTEALRASFEARNDFINASKLRDSLGGIRQQMATDKLQHSYVGRLGKTIQPVLGPLGFDWKMSVALLSGLSAKEVVVGTLGVLYQSNQETGLVQKLRQQRIQDSNGMIRPAFTPSIAISFMLFILIYFPCIGVVSAISRESGHWKWAAFIVVYTTSLAYLISWVVYTFVLPLIL